MKSIELTEERKSKLLEMCNKLFPDYYWNFDKCESKEYEIEIDNILTGTIPGKSEMDQTSEIVIHWFEFCMTHLAFKLCKKDFNALSLNTYSNLIQYNQHPIDYLYEEFKKLNNG